MSEEDAKLRMVLSSTGQHQAEICFVFTDQTVRYLWLDLQLPKEYVVENIVGCGAKIDEQSAKIQQLKQELEEARETIKELEAVADEPYPDWGYPGE